ncbi:MAG: general stress protein [Hymenobacter sp.]|nr:MAG: general stress protein [Hymenobacter sp.]
MIEKTTRPAARANNGTKKSLRGFASMDKETKQRIASEGGKASQAGGLGHKWTKEEAQAAGRKGGIASRRGANKPK